MALLAQGDGRAADALVERYRNALFAFLYRMNENRADAEDLFQETWLRVMRYRRTYCAGKRFSTWLFQIALNCTRDLAAAKRPAAPLEEEPEDAGERNPSEMEEKESAQALVLKLPLPYRETVILRYFHDMKESEIAEVSGIPLGTVKSRLHKALTFLRNHCGNEYARPLDR
jgi:RNA polymerase sigma-70 factor (ECF subfamily)